MSLNIEAMAREAGMSSDGGRWFSDSGDPLDAQDVEHAHLERFAALVLEEAARVCDIPRGTDVVYEVIGGAEGAELCTSLAAAIRALATTKEQA